MELFVVIYLRGRWKTKTNFSTLEQAQNFIDSLTTQKNSATIEILNLKNKTK